MSSNTTFQASRAETRRAMQKLDEHKARDPEGYAKWAAEVNANARRISKLPR